MKSTVSRVFEDLNPIPTSHGRNQPIYERHVTKSGRNRVKFERKRLGFQITVPLGDWLERKKVTAIIIKQQFGFAIRTT